MWNWNEFFQMSAPAAFAIAGAALAIAGLVLLVMVTSRLRAKDQMDHDIELAKLQVVPGKALQPRDG